jgi:hypothetical protein
MRGATSGSSYIRSREADFYVKRGFLRSDRIEGAGNTRVYVKYIQKTEYQFRGES